MIAIFENDRSTDPIEKIWINLTCFGYIQNEKLKFDLEK